TVPGYEMRQIVHIDRMCNECGNCKSFCPYSSAPFKDKLTLFSTREDFENSDNQGFLPIGEKRFTVRLAGEECDVDLNQADTGIDKGVEAVLWAMLTNYAYLL
ncbi:MAG: putative selenate reductase subunit YgfK, partial [Eubacteriales bacterium]|nr:putative selenate reductase subunit YgfK [Eubacteriales bacterium]